MLVPAMGSDHPNRDNEVGAGMSGGNVPRGGARDCREARRDL